MAGYYFYVRFQRTLRVPRYGIKLRKVPLEAFTMTDIAKHIDKAYEEKSFDELADAPVEALQGLSKQDAELLNQAFKIRTIRDLAESKFVLRAQAIVNLAAANK